VPTQGELLPTPVYFVDEIKITLEVETIKKEDVIKRFPN
jgi:hypothetical protein